VYTTPLPRKLGIRPESRVLLVDPPPDLADRLRPMPDGVSVLSRIARDLDVVVFFVTRDAVLRKRFERLAASIAPDGRLWVAWPKKASGVETDLTFDRVQTTGLETGLVDNKSASITDVFQGMQFVVRLRDRPR
jgi:hypothetical protein